MFLLEPRVLSLQFRGLKTFGFWRPCFSCPPAFKCFFLTMTVIVGGRSKEMDVGKYQRWIIVELDEY
jgi:hypothetical protein